MREGHFEPKQDFQCMYITKLIHALPKDYSAGLLMPPHNSYARHYSKQLSHANMVGSYIGATAQAT
eukprot:1137662-Pelagomonas_calceolata.AAC.11